MSEEKERPDSVVYNEKEGKYDASLKPYGTNVGAPSITTTDTSAWKNRSINKLNHRVQTKFLEIKSHSAKFSFEPVIGQAYHLYQKDSGEYFLSLISPAHCHWDFEGSYYLNAEMIWERLEEDPEA